MTVLVFDNDETTGYYAHLMVYINYIVRCRKLTSDDEKHIIPLIAQIARDNGVFRPGTAEFLQAVSERKKLGIVKAVVMYTNAFANPDLTWHTSSWGAVDWPHFLARVLGCLAGDDKLFDIVLSRPPHLLHIPYPKKHFTRVVEALTPIHPVTEDTRIIFFDDKPGEILGTSEKFITVHAPEYRVPITSCHIENMMQRLLPADAVLQWSTISRESILRDIMAMYIRCGDNMIPVPILESGNWCAFNIDRELPLPAVPVLQTSQSDANIKSQSSLSRKIRFRIVIRRIRLKKKWGTNPRRKHHF